MLFASTRLTLVRELGVERFRETVFVTEMQELTAEGWEKHEKHTKLDAPLTKEEEDLKGIKDAEAEESRGTGARASHVGNFDIKMDGSVSPALEGLKEGRGGSVVVIVSAYTSSPSVVLTKTGLICWTDRKSIRQRKSSS